MIAKLPDLDEWKKYFLHNEGNIQKITWSDNHFLSKEEKECISSSIAKFQLGENSEGKKLIDFCENYAQRYKDKTIKQITNLFIREEQAHSYILKRFMDSNNIATLERHWTDNLFRSIRSLAGYELSITVLITAEIIALTYYDALSKATQSKLLKNICLKIIEEERKHVLYESMLLKSLRKQKLPLYKVVIELGHKCLFFFSLLLVLLDHRAVILRGGFTSYSFWSQNWEEFYKVFD